MHFLSRIPKFFQLVLCSFFFLSSTILLAQNKSALDTIAYFIKTQKNQNQLCDDLNKLGNYYWNIGDIENALLAVRKSKDLADQYNYDKAKYDAWSIMAAIAMRQGDFATAISISHESLSLATKNQSEYGANKAYYILAVMAYQQGDLDSVISLSTRVLDAPHIVYDSISLPKFSSMAGTAYMAKGQMQNANERFLEALNIAERTNNQQLESVCISNLAIINQELNNLNEALRYQRKGLAMAQINNQVREIAGNYYGMGNSYKGLNMMDSAFYFYRKSLPLYKQVDSKVDIALVNTNIGGMMVYLNLLDSGMYYLVTAKQDFILLKDTINMAQNAIAMGDAWYRMAGTNQNRAFVNKALGEFLLSKNLAEIKELEDLKMSSYYYLSIVYEALGNPTLAFDYLKRYQLINNVIRSKEYTGQIADMQTKYDTEKKEAEIARLTSAKLLDAEKIARQRTLNYSLLAIAALLFISGFLIVRNVQHKRAAEKIVAILEKQNAIESIRNKIASDVHDEMGANLTRLGLNAQQLLQGSTLPATEKQLVEKMASQSKDIITGMREIIWASNPANDNLKSMLGFMRQYIDRFFDGTNIRTVVNFPHEVGEVTLHPEVRRNLFLILKESLNNAVKYSGSDRIDIDFRNENENFNLDIKDYGKGIDDSSKDDFSNGLRNMKMRAELIQSLFKLITAPGEGVQISIEGKLY